MVRGAKELATGKARPGMPCSQLDKIARGYVEDKGYGSYFRHGLGHGVGLEIHEGPQISGMSGDIIMPGMVFTIEPGIYVPGWGGIRIEDMVKMGDFGAQAVPAFGDGSLTQIN